MELLSQYPNKDLEAKVLKRLSEAYAQMQNNKEAYFYLLHHLALKDSVFDKEKSMQVKQLQAIYESNKKDVTIIKQEAEIELIEASNQFKTRLIWAISIGALFVFGSAWLYRSYRIALKAKIIEEQYSRQLLSSHEEERKTYLT